MPPPPPPGQRPSPLETMAHDLNLDDGQTPGAARRVRAVFARPVASGCARSRRCASRSPPNTRSPTVDMARVDALIDAADEAARRAAEGKSALARPARGAAQAGAARAHAPDPGRTPRRCRLGSVRQAAARGPRPPDVRRNRSTVMAARIGRRGFVGGAAALSAGLWLPLPGPRRLGDGFRRGPASPVAHHLRRDAGRDSRARGAGLRRAPSTACWPACGATALTPAPAWVNEGPAELRRQQQARGGRAASPASTARSCRSCGRSRSRAASCATGGSRRCWSPTSR